MKEFDCTDCGLHVQQFTNHQPQGEPDRCMECIYIATIESPAEQEMVRAHLRKIGAIGVKS